ncbi:CDP-glycerol glycerophosphotransferase family protein, partial [Anaerosporobacter sp.]
MKKISEHFKYWGQLFLIPIYMLSFLMPRDKKIWVLGSTFGKRFADNPRYFYLYLHQFQSDKVKAIWISKNKDVVDLLNANGYTAYYFKSLNGIWYALRAKVYLYDNYSKDINFWLSGGAVKVNMWHGIPLKKIQMDNTFDKVRHPDNKWLKIKNFPRRMSDEKPSHYVLTTSEYLTKIFKSAFNTNHVLVSGYPRNDVLCSKLIDNVLLPEERKSLELIQISKCKTILLYMPTFRDSEELFFEIIKEDDLKEYLKSNNILLCVKLHPKSKIYKDFCKLSGENIQIINPSIDPYILLHLADALITDYSSIYFDYLLLDRPIIFFNYDMQEYLSNTRELYFDYDKFTPG